MSYYEIFSFCNVFSFADVFVCSGLDFEIIQTLLIYFIVKVRFCSTCSPSFFIKWLQFF